MFKIVQSPKFKRRFKKYQKKHFDMIKVKEAVQALQTQDKDLLKTKYKDHALSGDWQGVRELHITDDWLLVYDIV
ncbi:MULTISPECIES: type II toxin-antitoxin system RelE/ParE family toxin [Aerococcus]|uniref:type II toxin-antitoxin system RelE/ParE family toxin n=1 Tax=Aerococcus urinae (strain CCUG 59500 / ACS-120-V-Col10a) TaxID=2976812 RepID=UPI000200E5B1|nr:type II toxin-antitoxin system YafQ family toxin [Aerococcus sp. Group 1]AEA01541.1 addiction module toxin, RelE/StbE family [Aerococcus sp. Group 1]MCY3030410.1 type II toxin-antitoxin system YafQ family toxin [Aerococcus sp. Group 1]MCY3054838.1 type II toxin-antitoxin system YafQ family toxin [Aerococcus sp. Group 1]MCY3056568.1 type II toxin-antitoxin system YafQ family toxin [Aerococcus sp. Group 1]MCY3061850.1 type II toxin-antitoxin system YafQ family toxin [Aerococcus sp. Group 1]